MLEIRDALARLAGWWGHELSTRFAMPSTFIPAPGAAGFQLSNPSVLDVISLYSALEVVKLASPSSKALVNGSMAISNTAGNVHDELKQDRLLAPLRLKSLKLTNYLEALLTSSPFYRSPQSLNTCTSSSSSSPTFTIITPSDPVARGAQLSLLFSPTEAMLPIFDSLRDGGVLGDERKPGVIRLAPVPMYSTFGDVRRAAEVLGQALEKEQKRMSMTVA